MCFTVPAGRSETFLSTELYVVGALSLPACLLRTWSDESVCPFQPLQPRGNVK